MNSTDINDIKERIKQFCLQEGLSIREFELKANLYNGFFIHVKSLSNKSLRKICTAYPQLDANWLLYGTSSPAKKTVKISTSFKNQVIELPLNFEQATDTIRISDNAMEPYYIAGDIVALKNLGDNPMIINGKEYVFEIEGLGKILRKGIDENTHITLSAYNSNFLNMYIPKEKIINYYNIVGLIRDNL